MNKALRSDADAIIAASLAAVQPDEAVQRALTQFHPRGGRLILIAAGKAAWQMAQAAVQALGHVDAGVVVTKYGHVKGSIPGVLCRESGHPVPDENGFEATKLALQQVENLCEEDTVLFLLSGGGSALFETASGQRRGAAGCYSAAFGMRRRYCGDEHHPQTAQRR